MNGSSLNGNPPRLARPGSAAFRGPANLLGVPAFLGAALWFLAWCPDLRALNPHVPPGSYRIDSWQVTAGLPSNDITAITQSEDGYLWIGTEQGLVRFDGVQFRVFDPGNTPELRQYHVSQLQRATGGNGLWIRTRGGSLTYRSKGRFQGFSDNSILKDALIYAIYVDRVNGVWAGAQDGRLFYIKDGQVVMYPVLAPLEGRFIRSMAEDDRDVLWIGTRRSLFSFAAGEIERAPFEFDGEPVLFPARDGGIWIAVDSRLYRFRNGRLEDSVELANTTGRSVGVEALWEDADGVLWIGTRASGLIRVVGTEQVAITKENHPGLGDNHITAVFEDREGNLWVGTQGAGLHRFKERLFELLDTSGGREENELRSICENRDGSLWIGSDGGGLFRYKDGSFTGYGEGDGLPNNSVWAVCEDSGGTLWVGTQGGGLAWLRDGKFETVGRRQGFRSRMVSAIYEDPPGNVWVGTSDAGLFRFRNGRVVERYSSEADESRRLMRNDVRAILVDREGVLWVGTGGGGLHRFGRNVTEVLRTEDGLPSNFIQVIMEDEEGVIWVGSMGGLSRCDRGEIRTLTFKDGLPGNVVTQIFEDDRQRLWLGSNAGIFRLGKLELAQYLEGGTKSLPLVVYDELAFACNGGSQPSGWRTSDGRLWFPAGRLAAIVNPEEVKINTTPPKVVIEDFRVNGESLGLGPPITVPPSGSQFIIRYTGLSLASPRKTRFRYKLEGYDKDWVEAGAMRVAQYEGLSPGEYTFRVIAANRDNVWNEIGASFSFYLKPPFWRTWWFLAAVVLAVMLAIRYLSVSDLRERLRQVMRQHALEEERARIAKDMHDDIGASLTQLSLLGELLRRRVGPRDEIREIAGKISDGSRLVSQKVDEIVWAVNPRNDTLDKLAAYLVHFAEEFFEVSTIRCRLDVPTHFPDRAVPSEVRHNIYMVVKEALNNVLKYSEANEVWLRMGADNSTIRIEVEDDGRGFEFDRAIAAGRGNGLDNMRRRIEDLGGKFSVRTQPGKGTHLEWRIELPH